MCLKRILLENGEVRWKTAKFKSGDGNAVGFNTGHKGVICSVKKDFPTRPRVKLLYDKKGNRIEGEQLMDLMKELTVFVIEVIRE